VRLLADRLSLQSDGAKKDAEMTAQWQELRSELRSKQTERENAGDAMVSRAREVSGLLPDVCCVQRKLRDRIKRAQDDLDGVAVTSADVEAATKDWDDAKAKLSALKAETTRADVDGRMREKNKEIRDLDQTREDLTVELNSLNRHADFRARLDVKKGERSAKEQEIQSLWVRCGTARRPQLTVGAACSATALRSSSTRAARRSLCASRTTSTSLWRECAVSVWRAGLTPSAAGPRKASSAAWSAATRRRARIYSASSRACRLRAPRCET
jgi:DNA repair exonuclease SbcCD ATPase subunit